MSTMFRETVFLLVITCFALCASDIEYDTDLYQGDVDRFLNSVDGDLSVLNRLSASYVWDLTLYSNQTLLETAFDLAETKAAWRNNVCSANLRPALLSEEQSRKMFLLCRGAKYTKKQARELCQILEGLSDAYMSTEVCLEKDSPMAKGFQPNECGEVCLKCEPDLERLMSLQNLTSQQLEYIWTSWHNTAGLRVKRLYPSLVRLTNLAARNAGYRDNGEVWREELEIPNLEYVLKTLYKEIHPLYVKLHAVIRDKLFKKYGPGIIDRTGPIPAHLLGSMWAQDWSSLLGLIVPENEMINLNENIANKNWTVKDMVVMAEDMYMSLTFPKMTEKFWRNSKFEKEEDSLMCHGSAANMFTKDDYRMLLCAEVNMEDFYVIHHEMGHIQYYMAYSKQPIIFQDGPNSAFQESIGDLIMTGVMAPQHLYRLGLITEKQLTSDNFDITLLLQSGLAKIPQLPYALLLDMYRWDIFERKISPLNYNEAFWYVTENFRGIKPPKKRGDPYFDAGAKFHIPDHTPYVRYFLSSILQMQMYKSMCELSVFGEVDTKGEKIIPFPLHKCDIYGSKKAGKKLRAMMEMGASEVWNVALKTLTGKSYMTVQPLLDYYGPLHKWLDDYIISSNIPVGW